MLQCGYSVNINTAEQTHASIMELISGFSLQLLQASKCHQVGCDMGSWTESWVRQVERYGKPVWLNLSSTQTQRHIRGHDVAILYQAPDGDEL